METARIRDRDVSRFILGSNPFSGFSHQTPEIDDRMRHYFTSARIKQLLAQADSLGVNTFIGRADFHVCRVLTEYWDEGGHMQWFAQTCPEVGSSEVGIRRAASYGAVAVHIHGGVMDYRLAQGRMDEVRAEVDMIHQLGLAAGIAGHNPDVFRWAEEAGLDVDYYMCSYYNAAHRDGRAEHVPGMTEWFIEEDRRIMTALIQQLSRPAIHYKVLAAGRNEPAQAFDCVARCMRENDAVCVGIYDEDHPDMLAEDVRLLEAGLSAAPPGAEQGAGEGEL